MPTPLRAWAAAALVACCLPCAAQEGGERYPSRPIRLIVPINPGGGLDTLARALSQGLGEGLGQPVVAHNRGGASGVLAADAARQAPADGHTLLIISSTLMLLPLMQSVPYDLERDFVPIVLLTRQPYVLVVSRELPVSSLGELIELARAQPGRLNYASTGPGSQIHLMSELFATMTATDLVHVPYTGIAGAYHDLVGNSIHMVFGSPFSAMSPIRAGRVRPLAVSGRTRMVVLPEVPTVAEAAVPGFAVTQWYGLVAPAGTSERIVQALNRQSNALLRTPEFARRLAEEGSEAAGGSPAELAALIGSERARWAQVIRRLGLQLSR